MLTVNRFNISQNIILKQNHSKDVFVCREEQNCFNNKAVPLNSIYVSFGVSKQKLFTKLINNIDSGVSVYDPYKQRVYLNDNQSRVIVEGNLKLEKSLNKLIDLVPEYKKTAILPDSRKGRLIFHLLSVSKNIINNEEYKKLSSEDKFILKTASIFHDMEKLGALTKGKNDRCHPFKSAVKTKRILQSLNIDGKSILRIHRLINTHHWAGNLAKGKWDIPFIASLFKEAPEDFNLAILLCEADVKAGNNSKHEDGFENYIKPVVIPEVKRLIKEININSSI